MNNDKKIPKITKLAVETLFEALREQRLMIIDLENSMVSKVEKEEFQESLNDKVTIEEVASATSILIDKKMKKKSKGTLSKKKIEKIEGKFNLLEREMEKFMIVKDQEKEELIDSVLKEIDNFLEDKVEKMTEGKMRNLEKLVKICDDKDSLIKRDLEDFSKKISGMEEMQKRIKANQEFERPASLSSSDFQSLFLKIEEVKFDSDIGIKRMQESFTDVIDSVIDSKLKEENFEFSKELKNEFSLLKNSVENFNKINKDFKKKVSQKILNYSNDVDKRLREILVSNVKIKEHMNGENMDFLNEVKENFERQFSEILKANQDEIDTVKEKLEILMNDQEELCKESSHLLTNICIKEEQSDQKFDKIFESFQNIEEKFVEVGKAFDEKFSSNEYITKQGMNEYFAGLKTELEAKVDLAEVQLALNEMQGKLQMSLVKNSHDCFDAVNNLKRNCSENFQKLFKYIKETRVKQRARNKMRRKGYEKENTKMNLGGSDEIVTNENMALIVEEIEHLKGMVEDNLSRGGESIFLTQFSEFENFLNLNKNSISELQELVLAKFDEEEVLRLLDDKAGKVAQVNSTLIRF